MRHTKLLPVVIASLLVLAPFTPDARAQVLRRPAQHEGWARVVRVIDGDTIQVRYFRRTERIRLLRVNTPERWRRGYFGARTTLERLTAGGRVWLVFERPGRRKRDMHGRLLAYVFNADRCVNVELVRLGWSRFWTRYGEGRFAGAFRAAEREARRRSRGLWSRGRWRP